MHKIAAKEFTLEDFSCEHLDDFSLNELDTLVWHLEKCREKYLECDRKIKGKEFSGDESICSLKDKQKKYWWQMIQLLPSSYNQTRNVMMNYEVLANIYTRKKHKLDCWRELCAWIETLPYSELITGNTAETN